MSFLSSHYPQGEPQKGFAAAFAAFSLWGLLPLFWKALESVDPFEVLCHRMVWSFMILLPIVLLSGRLGWTLLLMRDVRVTLGLLCTTALLGLNWYTFIWSINRYLVLETSLGYFINPLINVVLGVIVFKERPGRLTWLAIFLASCGVAFQVLALGELPVISLILAVSFALYGMLRKLLTVEALPGLFLETVFFLPFAAGYLLWQASLGNSAVFQGSLRIDLLLICSGIITTLPMFLFTYGARRIPMSTLGLFQYLSPTLTFLLGIFVFDKPLTTPALVTFACIWAALALYSVDSFRKRPS